MSHHAHETIQKIINCTPLDGTRPDKALIGRAIETIAMMGGKIDLKDTEVDMYKNAIWIGIDVDGNCYISVMLRKENPSPDICLLLTDKESKHAYFPKNLEQLMKLLPKPDQISDLSTSQNNQGHHQKLYKHD